MTVEKDEDARVVIRGRVSLHNVWLMALFFALLAALAKLLLGAGDDDAPGFKLLTALVVFFASFISLSVILARDAYRNRGKNYIELTSGNFVFCKDGQTVSYAWDRLRNVRVEERFVNTDGKLSKEDYFTADVIALPAEAGGENAALPNSAIAIQLEGFELPPAEIGKLMAGRTLAA
jgi:hypothetical protein